MNIKIFLDKDNFEVEIKNSNDYTLTYIAVSNKRLSIHYFDHKSTLHREDGPAVITYDSLGNLTRSINYINGRIVSKN